MSENRCSDSPRDLAHRESGGLRDKQAVAGVMFLFTRQLDPII